MTIHSGDASRVTSCLHECVELFFNSYSLVKCACRLPRKMGTILWLHSDRKVYFLLAIRTGFYSDFYKRTTSFGAISKFLKLFPELYDFFISLRTHRLSELQYAGARSRISF